MTYLGIRSQKVEGCDDKMKLSIVGELADARSQTHQLFPGYIRCPAHYLLTVGRASTTKHTAFNKEDIPVYN